MNERPDSGSGAPPEARGVHDAPYAEQGVYEGYEGDGYGEYGDYDPPRRGSRALRVLAILLGFAVIGLVIVAAQQNAEAVTLRFLWWSASLPGALLVFLLIVIGTAIGWLLRSLSDDDGFRPLG